MLKMKIRRKTLIRNKKGTLVPGTSAALKTDCAAIPHNPSYLEKEAPSRCEACLGHCSLRSDSVSLGNSSHLLRGPSFSRGPCSSFPDEPQLPQGTTTTALRFLSCACVNLVTATQSPQDTNQHFMKV